MDITPDANTQTRTHGNGFHSSFHFPRFTHSHPVIIDVNKAADEQLSMGDRISDKVASTVGSWPFIITQSIVLAIWIILNIAGFVYRWDPYPFILLNLALSFQAAYAAPFVMMSQNRQATKDRLTAENDYKTDCKGEEEIRHILEHLDHQDNIIFKLNQVMEQQHIEMLRILHGLNPEKHDQYIATKLAASQNIPEPEDDRGGNS